MVLNIATKFTSLGSSNRPEALRVRPCRVSCIFTKLENYLAT
ncbi:unnamed protein product [Tenebrio molitor]|nr:unnamed protein product [Tenebrio molitor]